MPFSIINPVYNGTKAWLHFWSMNLRTQLRREEGGKIRVMEIAPPMVGTDLHRDREDPDDNKKENNAAALTVEEFIETVADGFEKGEEMITAGKMGDMVRQWHTTFGKIYGRAEEGRM